MKRWGVWFWGTRGRHVWALALLAACEGSQTPTTDVVPDVDSNSNWLTVCDEDGGCGQGAACVCGVCTALCDPRACGEFQAGATCVVPGAASFDDLCDQDASAPAQGMCLPTCDQDADCGGGHLCLGGACVPPRERRRGYCQDDAQCREGDLCDNGRCVSLMECDSQEDCGDFSRCDLGRCVPSAQCRSDESCPQGSSCEMGRCIPDAGRCHDRDDCPEGVPCFEGRCGGPPEGCPEGEVFCGLVLGMEPSTLYVCEGGRFEEQEVCPSGCEPRRFEEDRCAPPCPEGPGLYCGGALGRDPGELYQCGPGGLVELAECLRGCEELEGPMDRCEGP